MLDFYKYFKLITNRKNNNPLFAIIVLTSSCNGDCSYCYMGEHKRDGITLPLKQVKDIIDQLVELNCLEVTFHGGEALLLDHLENVINYAKEKGLITHLVTNGLLLEQKIDAIRNIDSVSISLDGGKEFNDKVKNYPGYFEKALDSIHLLKKNKIKTSINCIILPGTSGEILDLCRIAKSLSVGLQLIPNICMLGDNLEINNSYKQELIKVIKQVLSLKSKGYPILASRYSLSKALDLLEEKEKFDRLDSNFCRAGSKSIVIDYDGYVYPCFSYCDQKELSINEMPLTNIIEKVKHKRDCDFCINFPYFDQAAILNLNMSVIFEYVGSVLKGRR